MNEVLKDRDYTIIIAKTDQQRAVNPPRFAERWSAAQASVTALIQKCEELDPDGITLYVSCQSADKSCMFKQYERVRAVELDQIVQAAFPPAVVDLQTVLEIALDRHFQRKAAAQMKLNGEMILILLDGEPADRKVIAKLIKAATHKLESNQELRISFLQIGEDPIAQGFLTALDENLQSVGAKFDIVSTQLLSEIQTDSLTEFLLAMLRD